MSESTPLIPNRTRAATAPIRSSGGSGTGNFYFMSRNNSIPGETKDVTYNASDHSAAKAEAEVETMPSGSNVNDFTPRTVMPMSPHPSSHSNPPMHANKGFFAKLFGFASSGPPGPMPRDSGSSQHQSPAPIGSLVKQRKIPIKVEPKVFFANERTFIAWLHIAVLLAGASIAIVSFADANPFSQLYGVILLPVAIAFIGYAMWQYAKRAAMIRRRDPGPYEDIVGPTVLGIMLMISIVANFALKLYSMLDS